MQNVLEFKFGNQVVEFDISGTDVLVNATEMALIYGKEPYEFLRLDTTRRFINELKTSIIEFRTGDIPVLNAGNADFVDENIVRTGRGKGVDGGVTWMHRQLALKFAAWLDPKFEVWIFRTVDQLLFEHTRRTTDELRAKAQLMDRKVELAQELQGNVLFQEYCNIDFKLRQIANRIGKYNTNQMDLFRADRE